MNRNRINTITKFTFVAAALTFMVACGGEPPLSDDVLVLEHQRDSLQEVLDTTKLNVTKLKEDIEKIEYKIDSIDGKLEILPKVETMVVSRQNFEHYFEVQGNIEAAQDVILYAEAGGNIRKIHVEEGQEVKSGQTLVSFDTELINKNILQIQTQLDLAVITFDKQKKLWDQNIGSEIQFLQAKTQKESLEQSLATLKSQRGKSTMSAPFSGIIDEILPKTGEMAGPGMPVLRLVNLSKLSVVADVNEKYLGAVAEGKLVTLHFPALGEAYDDTVELKSWGRYINPNNRTFKVKVDLPTTNNVLLPNLLVEVRIRDYQKANALVIPTRYIHQNSNDENYVYVLDKGQKEDEWISRKVIVYTGKSYKKKKRPGHAEELGLTEVTGSKSSSNPLKAGDLLVTEGSKGIQDDIAVEVKSSGEESDDVAAESEQ